MPSFEVHPNPSPSPSPDPSPNPHQVMPSFDVQPLPFYPFFLATQGLEYQTMPWFQLIRRAELAEAREEWCRTLGMSQAEYDASGAPDQRIARRRHLVNAAAPQLTELFLAVRQGHVPDGSLGGGGGGGGGGGDADAWRRAAQRCAECEASRWAAASASLLLIDSPV